MANQDMTDGTSSALPACTFTRSGYSFAGWGMTGTATVVAYADKASYTMSASNATLYALWGHTVKFNSNGGSGTMPDQVLLVGQNTALTKNSFTRSDYGFLGWSTDSSATIAAYTDGADYTISSSDVTLYAVWKKDTYSIGTQSITMKYVPAKKFYIDIDDKTTSTVTTGYLIADSEVTYQLWYLVRKWAVSNGYTFSSSGRQGADGSLELYQSREILSL
jgi:uncharacterized repeat protein (TIGR02543 family)